ncbi:MAG TPA: hypothetical protein VFU62_03080, partial [Hanamia sp.]|nr:hypothetical protein [Hanamia sp.]
GAHVIIFLIRNFLSVKVEKLFGNSNWYSCNVFRILRFITSFNVFGKRSRSTPWCFSFNLKTSSRKSLSSVMSNAFCSFAFFKTAISEIEASLSK